MKKMVPLIIVAVLLITAIPFVIVSATTNNEGTTLDKNGKIVGDNIPFDASMTRGIMSRDQLIQNEKELKDQLSINNEPKPDFNSEKTMTAEEIAEFDTKAQKAKENGDLLRELFSKGMKIVSRYYPEKTNEKVDDLQRIDRDMLETMVNVINDKKLNQNDEDILKQWIKSI